MRLWQTIHTSALDRHSHEHAYAAIVVSGGYEEAGDQGRFRVEAGDVVLHQCFETHINRFAAFGAVVLNLPLPADHSFVGAASVKDVDAVVRASEISKPRATGVLLASIATKPLRHADWPDELAAALIENPSLCLSAWSEKHGLTSWATSHGFARVFGISEGKVPPPKALSNKSTVERGAEV